VKLKLTSDVGFLVFGSVHPDSGSVRPTFKYI